MATIQDFLKLDICVGRIIDAVPFPEAKNPSYRLNIDFGDSIGVKKSVAQITKHYSPNDLQGRLVLAVVNFPARQIGKAISEVLTIGVPDQNNDCILIIPDKEVPLGVRVY